MEMYFVRHGETYWNSQGLLQGITDVPLSSAGIKQAKAAAPAIRRQKFEAIYTSPLKRALQTAKIIAGKQGSTIIVERRLSERYFGAFEGREIVEYRRLVAQDPQFNPRGAEAREEVKARIREFFLECIKAHKNKVLVVAHGGVFSALLRALFALEPGKAHNYSIGNCELYVIRVEKGNVRLIKDGKKVLEKTL